VSFQKIVSGADQEISGRADMTLQQYTQEILASGLPGIRQDPPRLRARQLESYLDNALEHDIPVLGAQVRRPRTMRAWLTSYAAATASTASYTTILDAATPGETDKVSKPTVIVYRELLERIRLLDPLPAWVPALSPMKRLGMAPKHHLVDPALAAALLGGSEQSLLDDSLAHIVPRQGSMLGALFESLVALTVRAFSDVLNARVSHMRTSDGAHEIDLIVERGDHKVIAIEVKLASAVREDDAKHLNWLQTQVGDQLIDKVIINTGQFAHRLPDGTAVIPLALLGA